MPPSKTAGSPSAALTQFLADDPGLRRDSSGSALPSIPIIRFRWVVLFAASPVRYLLRPTELLVPLADLTGHSTQPTGTFTSELPTGRSPFPWSGITAVATERFPPAGLAPAGTSVKLRCAESCHEVIRKANEDDLSARVPLSPLPDPEFECVVEIDIRQQRANTPALNCPYLTLHPFALFQHAGLEPFLNQVHDAPIGYAVLDEFHQPPLIESVIKLPDVGIEHPAHFSRSDPYRQRVQSLMWTTTGPEPIRESQEVLFVDRVQHLDGGTLDDFIFQRGDTERPKLARFTHLRDVHPAHRPCSVGSSLESMAE